MSDTQSNASPSYPANAPALSSIEMLRTVWRHWQLLLLASILLSVSVLGVSFLLTPKYRSTALLLYVSQDEIGPVSVALGGQLGRLSSLAGFSSGGESGKEEAIALLSARKFTHSFIRQYDLLPVLYADQWDADNGRWLAENPDDIPTLQDAFEIFNEEIRSVNVNRESGLISLSILWKDPLQAAEWANALVAQANVQLRSQAINEAKKNLEFLEEELGRTTITDVRSSIYELVASNVNKAMMANVREEYVFRTIDPALPSDPDRYESPNHLLFALLGVTLSVTFVLLFVWWRSLMSVVSRSTAE